MKAMKTMKATKAKKTRAVSIDEHIEEGIRKSIEEIRDYHESKDNYQREGHPVYGLAESDIGKLHERDLELIRDFVMRRLCGRRTYPAWQAEKATY